MQRCGREVCVGCQGSGGEGAMRREQVWKRVLHGREKGFTDCEGYINVSEKRDRGFSLGMELTENTIDECVQRWGECCLKLVQQLNALCELRHWWWQGFCVLGNGVSGTQVGFVLRLQLLQYCRKLIIQPLESGLHG